MENSRKIQKYLKNGTNMAPDVLGQIKGVDLATSLLNSVGILLGDHGTELLEFSVAGMSVVTVGEVRSNRQLVLDVPGFMGLWGQQVLKLTSTPREGQGRKVAGSQVHVPHATKDGDQNLVAEGLQTVVRRNSIRGNGGEIEVGDRRVEDLSLVEMGLATLIALDRPQVIHEIPEGRVGVSVEVRRHASDVQDAVLGAGRPILGPLANSKVGYHQGLVGAPPGDLALAKTVVEQDGNRRRPDVANDTAAGKLRMGWKHSRGGQRDVVILRGVDPLVVGPAAQQSHVVELGDGESEETGSRPDELRCRRDATARRAENEATALDVEMTDGDARWPDGAGENVEVVELVGGGDGHPSFQPGAAIKVVSRSEADGLAFAEGDEKDVDHSGVRRLMNHRHERMFFRITPGGDEALNFGGSNARMIGTNVRSRSWKSQRKNMKNLLLEKSISKKLEKEKINGQKWPKK